MKGFPLLIITGFVILCLVLPDEGPSGLTGVSASPKKRGGFGGLFSSKKSSSSSSGSSYPKQTWSNSGSSGGYPGSSTNYGQSGYPGSSTNYGQSGYPKQNYGGSSGGSYGSSSSSGGSFSNYGKKKSSTKSKLKKAAVIGAAVYGGYQLGKLTTKFSSFGGYGGGSWGFNDWNKWREADGMLCRSSDDCRWVDRNMFCQDYELDFQPSALWFGGDVARIVGECSCPQGMFWSDREVQCQQQGGGIAAIIGMIFGALIVLAVCVGVCICYKKRS